MNLSARPSHARSGGVLCTSTRRRPFSGHQVTHIQRNQLLKKSVHPLPAALPPSASPHVLQPALTVFQENLTHAAASAQGHILLGLPEPSSIFHIQPPGFFSILSFLLSHPVITFCLAVFLYVTIPRLWRAFIRFVVIPVTVLGAGYVVVKNPQSFSEAGSFIASFTGDHPYVTSAVILVGIALLLSPYLLTALLVLFLATGIPRLPAPIRGFLPAPVVEIEQQLASFSDMTRGPVDSFKEGLFKLGADLQNGGQYTESERSNGKQL